MDETWRDQAHETAASARLKVLVVDKDEINRLAVSLVLTAAGADVTCATPAEALEQLAHCPFDVLVMDGAGPHATLPVIPITARGDARAESVRGAAGMRLEIGRAIDPAALSAGIVALAAPARQAA